MVALDRPRDVSSIGQFLEAIERDYAGWRTEQNPWFRGEPTVEGIEPLLPRVFRKKHDENALLQYFRMRASAASLPVVPPNERIDLWMFLAQHVGLPTRLLDWSEGALIALYFAMKGPSPTVWMLNPLALNCMSVTDGEKPVANEPTLTWHAQEGNIYFENIAAAWSNSSRPGLELPVAVHPTVVHPRISAQHSRFTVHGSRREGLDTLVGEECLRCYRIRMDATAALKQLQRLGIVETTIYPEAIGLTRELEMSF